MSLTNQEKINFTAFRNQYQVPSDRMRIIVKKLGLFVERVGTEQYIICNDTMRIPGKVGLEYWLKHAIMEYRAGDTELHKTKFGNYMEFELKSKDGTANIGVSTFHDDAVSPLTAGKKVKPNKETKSLLIPRNRADELMMRQIAPPVAPSALGGMDALQVLVSALQAVQATQQPPDPLQAQRDLLEAAENRFLLTGEQVGELVGWSKSTITSKKSGFKKLGFQFEKVKEGSSTLYKVSQY
jgi:biotin operon repressor